MYNSSENTWSKSLKQQVIWFVFAVLLAVGTSYIQTKTNVTTVQTNVAQAEEEILELQKRQKRLDQRREMLRIDIERINQKINLLLREQGIDPSEVGISNPPEKK